LRRRAKIRDGLLARKLPGPIVVSILRALKVFTSMLVRMLPSSMPRVRQLGFVACAGFSLVLFAETLNAQVNVEPLRAQLKERGQAVNVRVSVAGQQGNTNGVQLSGGLFYGVSGQRNLFYVQVSGDFGHTNGATQVAKAFAHARYNRRFYSWLVGEVFAQWESDRFRRVQSRELFGTGPRFEVARTQTVEVVYGASYMLELTERTDFIEVAERRRTQHRFNNYGTLMYHVNDQVTLAETFYYQPRFDVPSDYWLLSIFGATFQVTPTLSSGLHLSIRHESNAPPPLEKTDSEIKSSLSLTF
jgi:hypothetical protein